MITGTVTNGQGRIRLKVIGLQGREQEVEVLLDTGYSEFLTLAPALVAELGLRWQKVDTTLLADGSECFFDVYEAKVMWDGKACSVSVAELGTTPLAGMALLNGYELNMQVRSGGKVIIKRLPEGPKGRSRRR
jgi:clan AA aspartic protease